ncbi:YlaI family protein [Virgibacillus soli]|uniref:YlaI family protein n=1 Tax=Paracerasibacillus soli TaxID=480284 RepID=A0ABU5CNY1_9BACI|nr:YlaI family protein [Virgibacillus soli]MDY0408066.1 YlaI family protein [Virgibacillus soli]
MKVKCVLCDKIEQIDDESLQAKRLKNRRINMYLCVACTERIAKKTNERHATGKFKLYQEEKDNNEFI